MDLAQLLARLRASSAAFSTRQLVIIGGVFVLVVAAVIGGSYWTTPTYRLLFADMDPAAASEVVDRLKTQKIPYQLDDGGRAIRVPEDRVDELRLALTAQGLPTTGRVGFEIFDRTAFGQTEFLEQVNYRRALEGEIARTVSTIAEVASARIHIALPKESLFESREQPAKASVVLKLKGHLPLPPATAAGIASLVASSVEGLRPENIVILDSFGQSLTRPAEAEEATGFGLERQQRIEHDLSTRVVSLLEPIVGAGRVRVNVAARLDGETRDETEERYDPMTVIRSHQTNSDSQHMASPSALIAGARANLAPTESASNATTVANVSNPAGTAQAANGGSNASPAAAGGSAAGGTGTASTPPPPAPAMGTSMTRTTETTNYEVSKLVRHSTMPRGELARLWVAVLVDDDVQIKEGSDAKPMRTQRPRTPAELQKIQGLVAAAVGLDQDRGDQLTVENITFDTPATEETTGPTPLSIPAAPRLRPVWIGVGVGAVVVVLVLIGVSARAMTKRQPAKLPAAAPGAAAVARVELPQARGLPRTVQEMQTDIEAQLNAEVEKATGAQKLPALARRVGALASKEPETVALLVRSWMTEDRH